MPGYAREVRRLLTISLLLLVVGCGDESDAERGQSGRSAASKATPSSTPAATFTIATGRAPDGLKFVVRRNASVASLVGDTRYQDRVGIAVPATADQRDSLADIEDALTTEFGKDSVLAFVLTAAHFQEFVFYTRNPEAAATHRDAVAAEFPDFEIQMHVERDAGWKAYSQFRG
jgi:hypothetical protein